MHQRRRQLRKPRPRSLQKRDSETSQDSREPTFDFVDPARAFGTPNSPGRMSVNNRRPRSLPVLRPITSFSPVEEGSNPASLPAQATALSSRAIINSTSIINILIHLLCKQQESDPARRKLLFSAFCTMIEQINTSLYLPPQALTQLQGFPTSVQEEFENLFKEVQSQFATSSASLAVPSLQYPPNPVGRLSGLYEQLWDDRYSREFLENGVLGMGGFGVVMEAKNKLDGQLYAVKMIDIGKQSSGLNHKILLREVQALAQLEHPNIVRYYSTWLQWYCIPHQLPDHPYTVNSSHQSTQVPIRSMCKFGALGACPQVTIQELSSSETESEAFDEASDGIVFRDDSTFQKSVSSIYESSTKCTVKVEEKLEVTSSCREKNNVESSSSASVDSCEQENNHMKMEIFSDALRNFGHCSSLYPLDISYHSPKFSSALKKRTCAGKALKKNGANNREFLGGIRNHKDNSFFNSTSDTSSSSSSDEDFRICFRKNVTGINSTEDSNSSSSSSKDDYKYTGSLQRYCSTDRDTKRPPRVPSMTLFIQMGLCKGSLKDWLINRNESPTPLVNHAQCLGFIKQILSGVEYIHTQNIIHRDLKPANIFFNQDGNHLLIGDFGLARPLSNGAQATRVSDVGNSISPIPEHAPNTCDIGTPIYTAPEVKTGDKYGFKSDVHNLGIILLELFQPFQTGFERIHVIDALKVKRHLDQSLICHWPDIAPWILKLTDPDPDKRPLPSDVLKSILFHPLHPDRRYCKVPNSQGSDASTVLSMPVSVNSKYFDEHKYLSSLQKQMEPRPVSNIQDTHQDCEASSSTDISASDSLHMQKRLYATELYQKDIEIARLREENQELHKIIEKLQHQVKCFNGLTECKKL